MWCVRPDRVEPQVAARLRASVAGSGVPEAASCPEGDGAALFVSDRLDDLPDVAVREGVPQSISLLGESLTVVASRREVRFKLEGGEVVAPLTLEPASVPLALRAGRVRLRVAAREQDGVLVLKLHDIHLECA
jgi:hypothetical protein